MPLWQQRESDACPRCGQPEDSSHVWICDQMGALDVWNKSLLDLGGWIESINTDPDIIKNILSKLTHWMEGLHPAHLANHSLMALEQQSDIGWNLFIEGWLTFERAATQEAYYNSISSRQTGEKDG